MSLVLEMPAAGSGPDSLPAAIPTKHRPKKQSSWIDRLNDRSVYKTFLRVIRDTQPQTPVLLAPCSFGWFFEWFARDGIPIQGIEIEPDRVAVARARTNPPTPVVQGNIMEMPFADSSFDLVISNRFILHFNDEFKAKAMKELARVTRKHVLVHYDYIHSIRQWGRILKGKKVPEKNFADAPGYRIWKRQGRKLRYTREMMQREGEAAGLRMKGLYFVSYLISERVYCLYEKP